MQWVCSLRDSLQGLDELTLPIRPTNRLPTSPLGAGPKATGRRHCYICNFSRVAHATLQCKSRIALFLAPFRDFLRIPTARGRCNPKRLWKGVGICGKHCLDRTRSGISISLRPRNNPQIRQPIHEKLHGQRHQQQPHDPHQDANSRLPQHRPHPSRPRQH